MIYTLSFAIVILFFSTFVLNKVFPSKNNTIDFEIESKNSLKHNSIWVILIAVFTVFYG